MIDWKRLYRLTLLAAPIVIGAILLIRVRSVLFPFILAFVITYLIYPIVRMLVRHKVPPVAAILLVYLMFASLFTIIGVWLVPILISQLTKLAEMLPSYFDQITEALNSFHESFERMQLPETVKIVIEARLVTFEESIGQTIGGLIEGILGMVSYAVSFILAPIFAFYLLRDIEIIKRGIVNLIPIKYKSEGILFLKDVDKAIGGYIRGQLIVILITGTISGITMALLGIRFAVLIGVFVAITDIIPYIGPIVGTIPAVMIALLQSPVLALYVLAAFVLIQQIEASIIAPRVVSHRVGLHPLIIIFSLFVAREILGIPGMLIAVPSAATIRVFLKHFYKHLV